MLPPTSTTILHKNAELLIVRSALYHFEHNILDAGGLSDLPVYTCAGKSSPNWSDINYEISNLSIEIVLVRVPFGAARISFSDI